MKYKIIDTAIAGELARAKLRGEPVDFSEHEKEVGKGAPLSDAVLAAIAKDIDKLKRSIEKKKGDREELDRQAFELVHRKLPNAPDVLGDSRFWIRFALVYLFDVIVWRFPGKSTSGFNLENLGLGASMRKRGENYPYKLWVRGELSRKEKGADPYKFGRFGGIDFWTSHIHRQGFAKSRAIATELIQFQYPVELKGRPRLWPGEEDAAKAKRGIRTLVKRIRRLWATVEYTLLDAKEIQKLLRELSRGLRGPDGKPVST
jgi:hypothetical protein